MTTKSIATLNAGFAAEYGRSPIAIITREATTRPTVRNFLASERSDNIPIPNLLNAYAIERAEAATPIPNLSANPSAIISGAASDRFFLTR